jgi:hypothetical protein
VRSASLATNKNMRPTRSTCYKDPPPPLTVTSDSPHGKKSSRPLRFEGRSRTNQKQSVWMSKRGKAHRTFLETGATWRLSG